MNAIRFSKASAMSSLRSESGLTIDSINRVAPAVLAAAPHPSRSEKYKMISTYDLIIGLGRAGFVPYEVRQTRSRTEERRAAAKHMLRLRHESQMGGGTEVGEVVLLNSHDGTSPYRLMAGVFRMVCSNGLIAGDIGLDLKVQHSGKIDEVVSASFEVLNNFDRVRDQVERFKQKILSEEAQRKFAQDAIELRWGQSAPIEVAQALEVRRTQDLGQDAWTILNRIQENVVRGGLPGVSKTGKPRHTRTVTNLSENVRINRGVWSLAEALIEA